MTTEPAPAAEVPEGGEMDVDQASLTIEDGATEPQFATKEEVSALLARVDALTQSGVQTAQLVSQTQGHTDRGLNALRRDFEPIAQQVAQAEIKRQQETALAGIEDEGLRATMALLFTQQNGIQTAQAVPPPADAPAEVPAAADPMGELREIVEDHGLDPNTPGIDYASALRTDLPLKEKRKAFFASITAAQAKGPSIATAPSEPVAPASPPRTGATAPTTGRYRSKDDVYDAFNADKIDFDGLTAGLKPFGAVP